MDQFNRELRQLRQDIERAQARSQQLQHRVELSQLFPEQKSEQQLANPLDAQPQNKP
jgi:carbonic anhydrase